MSGHVEQLIQRDRGIGLFALIVVGPIVTGVFSYLWVAALLRIFYGWGYSPWVILIHIARYSTFPVVRWLLAISYLATAILSVPMPNTHMLIVAIAQILINETAILSIPILRWTTSAIIRLALAAYLLSFMDHAIDVIGVVGIVLI